MKPITGRTHQLRAHAEAIGHPIIGDPKYGVAHRARPRRSIRCAPSRREVEQQAASPGAPAGSAASARRHARCDGAAAAPHAEELGPVRLRRRSSSTRSRTRRRLRTRHGGRTDDPKPAISGSGSRNGPKRSGAGASQALLQRGFRGRSCGHVRGPARWAVGQDPGPTRSCAPDPGCGRGRRGGMEQPRRHHRSGRPAVDAPRQRGDRWRGGEPMRSSTRS